MAYQLEEEQALQRQRLTDKAVSLAVQGRWKEAGKLNKEIIERFPGDVEAYNRLGKALTELGEFAQAKKAYLKALKPRRQRHPLGLTRCIHESLLQSESIVYRFTARTRNCSPFPSPLTSSKPASLSRFATSLKLNLNISK